MLSFLKNHPFAVEAFFKNSIVLTFAFLKEEARELIPQCLEPDTFNSKWAFIAVAIVDARELRPKGFPKFTGSNFFLIGYRVFVRFTTGAGRRLRGLYILRSETNKKKMEILGNIFTHYNYYTTDINLKQNGLLEINSKNSAFNVLIDDSSPEKFPLPEGSPFTDWKEARRFAGPLPFTFSCNDNNRKVLVIEGVRKNWTPKPVKIIDYQFSFLNDLKSDSLRLANAFIIKNIPYSWKKGKIECIN